MSSSFSLSVADVTRVATDAVRQVNSGLEVVGVMLGGGGGEYAEVLLRVQGCQQLPCQVSLGVFRDVSEQALHQEIVEQVRRHMTEHPRGE